LSPRGAIPARRLLRARHLLTRDADAVVLALAADHVVRDPAAFVEACRKALSVANAGRIVTFGVLPERPATEYGYIRPGDVDFRRRRKVAKFVESRITRRQKGMSPTAISGTAETSCSARRCCSMNIAASMPTA
jgi:mannose-1-phosphate guanylyltransferase